MILISCEHGGNRLPPQWRERFDAAGEALASHRGYDPGALLLARQLARRLNATLCVATVSRLLVDLNRSLSNRAVFSEWSRALSPAERQRVLRDHYHPYRQRVERCVTEAVAAGSAVLHISVHSFTPHWNGSDRAVDVGLLYDPRRPGERASCRAWKAAIEQSDGTLRVRMNNPYRGASDGLTTHLRKRFAPEAYQGIELEVSQGIVAGSPARWKSLRAILAETIGQCAPTPPSPLRILTGKGPHVRTGSSGTNSVTDEHEVQTPPPPLGIHHTLSPEVVHFLSRCRQTD